jgi:hypothetical protein
MGYRSDVGLCLDAPARERLEKALQELDPKENSAPIILEFFQSAERREDKESGSVAYLWRNVKWNDEFPDIAFVEGFLDALDDADWDRYLFLRVGEDEDDTEIRGTFWGNAFGMCLVRGIAFS